MKHLYKIVILLLLIINVSIAQTSRLKLFTTYSQYNEELTEENQQGILIYLHTHAIDNTGIGLMLSYESSYNTGIDTNTYSYIAPIVFYQYYNIHSSVFIGVKSKINAVTENSRENKYEPTICGGLIFTFDRYFFKPLFKIGVTPKSFTLTIGIGI